MEYAVQTRNLTKTYQGQDAVSDVSMNIKKGEIYGFLGPNGAGKSTIMKMLTNLIKPSHGSIDIFGEPLGENSFEYLKRVGSMIEYPVFYEKMTALENMKMHCDYMGYHNKEAIGEALSAVGLEHAADRQPNDFSMGMRQRLSVARAIITKPELLILDEPINGLDPAGIKLMRNLFMMLNREYGMTLLISSHIIGEIEHIADTVSVIKDGRLIEETSMDILRERNTEYLELTTNNAKRSSVILHDKLKIENFKILDEQTIRIYSSEPAPSVIANELITQGINIESMNTARSTLEDYFIKKVGLEKSDGQLDSKRQTHSKEVKS